MKIAHRFVECIPDSIESGVLYISITYATAMHLCACGCSREVVTPFSPTDWELLFDGETVSLTPSIGNWNFPCRSHYFIKRNRIELARKMSQRTIDNNREYDRWLKMQQYAKQVDLPSETIQEVFIPNAPSEPHVNGLFARIVMFFKNNDKD